MNPKDDKVRESYVVKCDSNRLNSMIIYCSLAALEGCFLGVETILWVSKKIPANGTSRSISTHASAVEAPSR